jgi:hypothetical protein
MFQEYNAYVVTFGRMLQRRLDIRIGKGRDRDRARRGMEPRRGEEHGAAVCERRGVQCAASVGAVSGRPGRLKYEKL